MFGRFNYPRLFAVASGDMLTDSRYSIIYGLDLGEGVATHSRIAWKIPWTDEPGSLQSMKSQKSHTQLSH